LRIASRPSLPLIAVALVATLCLVCGILRPGLNYDVIPYAALAKQMRGAGGKAEAYRELASKVGDSGFGLYVSGAYRERMYRDDGFFQVNLPLYTIRPFYIFLCSVIGLLVGNDVAATYIVSAVAASLALLLSYAIACIAGLAGNWRLAVPLTWITAGGLNLAGLSTPDALETLLTMLFVLISITGPWKGGRAVCLILFGALMVATRTDALLLVVSLAVLEWLLKPRHRLVSALVFLMALSSYLTVETLSGNWGYIALLNFVIDHNPAVVPNHVPNLPGYIKMAVSQTYLMLGADFEHPLFLLAVSLLATAWLHERRVCATREADSFNQQALILCAALAVYLVVRFALFPLPLARYVTNAYVLAGILFARAIQPTAPRTAGFKAGVM